MKKLILVSCMLVFMFVNHSYSQEMFPAPVVNDEIQPTAGKVPPSKQPKTVIIHLFMSNGWKMTGALTDIGNTYYTLVGHQTFDNSGPTQLVGMARSGPGWANVSFTQIPIFDARCPITCQDPAVIGGGMTYDSILLKWSGTYALQRMTGSGLTIETGTWESADVPFPQ